jgi:hypothetical protein
MSEWTKEHRKEYDRLRHRRDKAKIIARKAERIKEIRAWMVELKSTMSCSRCPENHPSCLQFHHRNDKDIEVSNMVGHGYSKEKILAEIAKCDVLCANCHSKHHYNEKES